ncbi:MAG: HAMP domain-containing histidine kinase [Alphaproteobacteria bacterium]|nr:HAMP domain-containing histidine kinase [Alphaproteobacteria bacterium]
MMTDHDTDTADRSPASLLTRFRQLGRGLFESLPGQLLMLVVGFIAIGMVLVYFPAVSAYRYQWMMDRAEAAHLAALAADVVDNQAEIAAMTVEELLQGADAIAVSRVRDGINELMLYGGPVSAPLVQSDLRTAGWLDHLNDTLDLLVAPDGRLLRIRAEPPGRPGELIDVMVLEAPLKREIHAFSRRLLFTSVLVALAIGAVVYTALFVLFVRPMRQLASSMMRFREAPEDLSRSIVPSGRSNEIGLAEEELARMQTQIRQALQQRERLAALGEAVAKISHDLRNVLTSAQLVSDRLAMDDDERVRKMGERLVRAVDRGVRLCQAALEYGRADEQPLDLQPVALRELLDEASGDARLSEGEAAWSNQVDETLVVEGDADYMHRIFLNLFRNALQAMHAAGGEIRLSVSTRAHESQLFICVEDSGPGLPPKARDNLFKAFTSSTRKGGTGLGLSISRELAKAHGGDLVLETTGESGTVFTVIWPVSAD